VIYFSQRSLFLQSRALRPDGIYEIDGRQFIVVAAGGGKGLFSAPQPSGAQYIAFSLPE
jgi:hypothetical protein